MRRVFVMALALLLPACAEVQTGIAEAERTVARVSPAGPISIIYRDDESNERILNGVVSYDSVLGRDRAVHFTVKNQSAEPVCDGTFTKEGPNNGKFSLSCFGGYFSGNGQYERKTGDPNNSFIAHGQTSRGFPIMLVIGRPVSRPAGNYGAHLIFVAPADSAAAGRPHQGGPAVQALEPIHEKAMPVMLMTPDDVCAIEQLDRPAAGRGNMAETADHIAPQVPLK
jgi:hypothetical protein